MTRSSTRCRPGDVVLVPFPFTDQTQRKLRPAVVVSPESRGGRYRDIVLRALTTQPQHDSAFALASWREAGLPKPTWIKPGNDVVLFRAGRAPFGKHHGKRPFGRPCSSRVDDRDGLSLMRD